MRFTRLITPGVALAALAAAAPFARADTLVLKDGTTLTNCFVRDEGVRLLVWEKMADVGTPRFRIIPRSQVAVDPIQIERDASWDVHPPLPDLTVAFIDITPKLPSLHWMIQYDELGTPTIKGAGKTLTDLGEVGNRLHPDKVAEKMKLKYEPGEVLTLTANIKNVGFKTAKPFNYVWLIDGKEVARGKCGTSLKELEWAKFSTKYRWQEGQHTVSFKITTVQPEIAVINNEVTDPLWAWGITYVLNPKRTKHDLRTAYGTFCFEDYYRWHLDIMNVLFAATKFPTSPDGVRVRVRLDRIIFTDNPNGDNNVKVSTGADGFGELQAMWTWTDSPEEIANNWPTGREIRDSTEWSLPHELAHQLGIPDWYAQDNNGSPDHLWADNGEQIRHLMNHPNTMQHNHGPFPWNEVDAMYWNQTWDKPRGYFGDYMFAIPDENYLSIVDVNGQPVEGAKVEVFQRAITVDPNSKTTEVHGVTVYPADEVNADPNLQSKYPVMVYTTGKDGLMWMPNRPAREVITLNGFRRKNNPFGNIDCVGTRGQLLIKVTKYSNPCYYFLDAFNFNEAWVRGFKDKNTFVLKTPYRSTGSPAPPINVTSAKEDADHVKITWAPPANFHEQQYLDKVIGYKVYRRIGPMALNDRPWFEVGTFNADARECTIDLKQRPMDNEGYSDTERYAVASLGELSISSELVQAPMKRVDQ